MSNSGVSNPNNIEANDVLNLLKDKINAENKENKEKILQLEKEISEYKAKISIYEEKIKSLEGEEEKKEETPKPKNTKINKIILIQEQNLNGPKMNSQILKLTEELCYLRAVMMEKENNKLFNTQLLYRLSRDGFTFESFHKKVDFISPLIILIETKTGKRLGATSEYHFIPFSFRKYGKKEEGKKSIIFGFNKLSKTEEKDEIACFYYNEEYKDKETNKTNIIHIDAISFSEQTIVFKNNMKNVVYGGKAKEINKSNWSFGDSSIFNIIRSNPDEFEAIEVEVYTYNFE